MKSTIFGAVLTVIAAVSTTQALAGDILARFEGGIGVIPVSSAAGPVNEDGTFPNVNRNDVRGVPPAGQIWVISRLSADAKADGRIIVRGEGLLLGGGNGIGTNANARVFATLFCGAIESSSNLAGVPLEANGDFRIEDLLSPPPPALCDTPVLLIRTANGGRWFAAGIPRE